jgi:hypothetical protein
MSSLCSVHAGMLCKERPFGPSRVNANGVVAFSPGLFAAGELPWVRNTRENVNPDRVAALVPCIGCWRNLQAAPAIRAMTPEPRWGSVGLSAGPPRVVPAAPGQPWAGGFKPVGLVLRQAFDVQRGTSAKGHEGLALGGIGTRSKQGRHRRQAEQCR